MKYPPIIGVDVSGGFQRDSSAITVVDSYSTRVTAELNSNFISTPELALVIHTIVSKWMPNAVVNIERNGGFGSAVISRLLQTNIKSNLFYSIKDKVVEERVIGTAIHKRTQKTKVFGSDSTKAEREKLMEILRDRVEYHKDKIISPIIYEELCGLEVKKNGKIEHSSNTHDDQVFSWLWALFVYYEGGDLMNNWGITKRVLRTDADLEEAVVDIQEDRSQLQIDPVEVEQSEEINQQLEILQNSPGKMLYEQWMQSEQVKDEVAMAKLMADRAVRMSLSQKYNMLKPPEGGYQTIPTEVFLNFNVDDDQIEKQRQTVLAGNLAKYW